VVEINDLSVFPGKVRATEGWGIDFMEGEISSAGDEELSRKSKAKNKTDILAGK
jgi:hypothetical protein